LGSKLEAALLDVAEKTRAQAEAARLQALAAHELPELRSVEAEANSDLQKLVLARETLDGEERRTESRIKELEHRVAQTTSDIARESTLIEDAAEVLARLVAEAAELANADASEDEIEALRGELAHAEAALAISEKTLAQSQDAEAGLEARRAALEATIQEESQRLGRLLAEIESVRQEHGALTSICTAEVDISALQMALDETLATALRARA
jgi:chromosome segregation protein